MNAIRVVLVFVGKFVKDEKVVQPLLKKITPPLGKLDSRILLYDLLFFLILL
jgi:hypothetical protein